MDANLAESATFIRALTGSGLSPFTAQLFDDSANKDWRRARILHGTLTALADTLVAANRSGCGIFVTVNETDLRGRKAANVVRVRALFVEFDGNMPKSFHLDPSMVVQSKAGWHCYWVVTDCPLTSFSDAQKRLIQHYNSDQVVHDLPRVMRLPGFQHLKREPFMVELLEAPGHRYTTAQALDGIAPLPAPPERKPLQWTGDRPPRWREVDPVQAFVDAGLYGRPLGDGKHAVLCPWGQEHTRQSLDASAGDTVIWETGLAGKPVFKCAHSHCDGRYMAHALRELGRWWT